MYDIFIKNYYESGTLITDEKRLYSVPIQQDDLENVLTEPTVSSEVGKTGTFEFTIYPNHPYYHALAQMRTIMRVDYDGDTIFRGRILTIDNTLTGVKKVHCEGDMAFLLDSFQTSSKKESRSKITLNAYIKQILDAHNQQMSENGETDKNIYPGYIPGDYPSSISSTQQIDNVTEAFGSDSYEQSMNALEAVVSEYGGFFRTRYSSSDEKTYLDWCKHWFRKDLSNSQPIAITQNIIDAQSNSEVDNIFTALIPIGKSEGNDIFIEGYRTDIHGTGNRRILVPQIANVFTEDQLNNGYMTKALYEKAVQHYGIIYKVQNFSNADTQAKLWEYACDWIKNNYVGGITNYDLSAVDMHHVNNRVIKYLAGDCINLTLHSDMTELDEYNPDKKSSTVNRTLLSVKYNLHHPDKNSYTAGISSDILNREYGTASTSKSKSAGGGGGGGAGAKAGGGKIDTNNDNNDTSNRQAAMEKTAWKLVWDETYNNEEYQTLKKKEGGQFLTTPALQAAQVTVTKVLTGEITTPREVGAIVLDAQNSKIKVLNIAEYAEKFGSFPVKTSPAFQKVAELDDTFVDALCSVTIGASDKAFKLSGKNSASTSAIYNKLEDLVIPENATAEEITELVNEALKGTDLPNDVLSLGTTTDANENESGFLKMGKEAVEDISLDAGGNNGKGTAQIGKKSGEWLVQVNEPLKYRIGDQTYTLVDGAIDSRELSMLHNSVKPIPSFSTQFAEIDTAIMNRATIGQLDAAVARIDTLRARVADIETLVSDYANIKTLVTSVITNSSTIWVNTIYVSTINSCTTFSFKGHNIITRNALASNGTDTIPVLSYW